MGCLQSKMSEPSRKCTSKVKRNDIGTRTHNGNASDTDDIVTPIDSSHSEDEEEQSEDETSIDKTSSRSLLHQLVTSIRKSDSIRLNNKCVHVNNRNETPIEAIYDGVHDGPVLGYGITGVVRLVTHKETKTEYAVKTLSLAHAEEACGLDQLREELAILMQLDHPNIVKLVEIYESDQQIYLIQELCRGGDLFDRLDAQPDEHYSEAQCARLVKQMLSAVRYIHSKGIIHRDLKLENFLFDHDGSDSELKMIDFGLSKHFKLGEAHHEPVGTRYTVAPEVLTLTYDEKVDIWALGVITFLLLSGDSPFGGCSDNESMNEVRNNILNARYSFEPKEYWSHVSEDAKDFISMILVANPNKRPCAEECQNSKWLQEWAHKDNSESQALSPNVLDALRSFRGVSDLRKLLCEVIGSTLLPEQISHLRKEFEKLDMEQTGEISLENLKKVVLRGTEKEPFSFRRGLTEAEVEEIFNSMRLHKSDTTIHWHRFLAAELSVSGVDERNTRLAFDRLDHNRKGYITLDDVIGLVGREPMQRRQESFRVLWGEQIEEHKCGSGIDYDTFEKMMSPDALLQ